MKNWVNGAKVFMRYFSYICVWFAFVMALMSFNIQTNSLGWVVYVIGVMYISTYMTIHLANSAEQIFGYAPKNRKTKRISYR